MNGIGGNTKAMIQVKSGVTTNAISEQVPAWADVQSITGWLDQLSGDSSHTTYAAKVRESTHVFVADYEPIDSSITEENSRAVINGKRYDIILIDNPMDKRDGSQLEIYLKYTGGQ